MSRPNIVKAKPNYWYSEDDIAQILKLSTHDNVNIFAQTQFEHVDLLKDNFKQAIENVVETGETQLIPIHLHGNHWAGAIVRMQNNGKIQVIYNDPLSESIESQPNATQLVAAVTEVATQTDIIDLQLRQQRNGNDCGPFTTDNLIRLASAASELDGLTAQEIIRRRILATPTNGSALEIRNHHAQILPRLRKDVEDIAKLPKNKVTFAKGHFEDVTNIEMQKKHKNKAIPLQDHKQRRIIIVTRNQP
jgi:hypothetical protein